LIVRSAAAWTAVALHEVSPQGRIPGLHPALSCVLNTLILQTEQLYVPVDNARKFFLK
jgi:hypothetical protein